MKNPFSLEETYREVYVIDFKGGVQPVFSESKLKPLGKWFKEIGKTWVCQSEQSIEDFRTALLAQLHLSADQVTVKKGTWPVAVLS